MDDQERRAARRRSAPASRRSARCRRRRDGPSARRGSAGACRAAVPGRAPAAGAGPPRGAGHPRRRRREPLGELLRRTPRRRPRAAPRAAGRGRRARCPAAGSPRPCRRTAAGRWGTQAIWLRQARRSISRMSAPPQRTAALGRVGQAHQETGDRALAAAAGPEQRGDLAGGELEVELLEDRLRPARVGVADALERERPAAPGRRRAGNERVPSRTSAAGRSRAAKIRSAAPVPSSAAWNCCPTWRRGP